MGGLEHMNLFDDGGDISSKVFDNLVGVNLLDDHLRKEVCSAFRNWYSHLPNEQKQPEIEALNNSSRVLLQLPGEEFSCISNDTPEAYSQHTDGVGTCIWDWVKNFKYPEYVYLMNRFIPIKRKSTELPYTNPTSLLYDVYTRSISLIAIMKDGSKKEFLPIHKVSAVVLYGETVNWDALKAFVIAYYAAMFDNGEVPSEYFGRGVYYGSLDVSDVIGVTVNFPEEDVTKECVDLECAFTKDALERADHTQYANLSVDMRDVCCRVSDRASYMLWCAQYDTVYNEYEPLELDSIVEEEDVLFDRLNDDSRIRRLM